MWRIRNFLTDNQLSHIRGYIRQHCVGTNCRKGIKDIRQKQSRGKCIFKEFKSSKMEFSIQMSLNFTL